ncbi:ABC transporter ATP-binding protein [Deinococcus cellulosilyticus]|uniref:ABC transporter ATP-binding protein n=1 Tax=Deinococcus cellulosilyticus (strain DSM 18568 / NBRC 106333 / KACC 11606 / 5516J-15) TaxID=1223518 RepID=A0A511MXF8_DEIC1|nr:ABC transporter ATP-binding protein [Deinococcus cellulosilyticus]GEM45274.1 ABC transporter ATP-binding protein [Deinococcus cellulosilyticus NBRC 106333 = KACC 11606]
MIELIQYSKTYGAYQAVKPLSLTMNPGVVTSLLGPNGAGKTTTIRAIVGLTRPSAGQVKVQGIDVWKEPLKAKKLIGYIPDRPYLYGKLSARELLRFIAGVHNLGEVTSKIENWLQFFSLEDFGNSLIETYSHGMKQKLTVIAAMLPEPPVLVVDEPMVGLDPKAAKQVRELLQEHARKGNTVLLTTHSMPLAETISEKIAVLHKGQLRALGNMEELKNQTHGGDLEEVFFKLLEEEAQHVAAT